MTRILTYIILLVTFAFLLFTCNYGEEPYLNTVNVRVLSETGFKMYWITAGINTYQTVLPDAYGYCKFNNVSLPYTLNLCYRYFFEVSTTISIKNLNLPNPVFCLPMTSEDFVNNFYFTDIFYCLIKTPTIGLNKSGFLTFVSVNNSYCQQERIFNETLQPIPLFIQLPDNRGELDGYIVYLETVNNSSDNPYDKFGFKQVKLRSGIADTFTFTESEISFDPEESYSSFQINFPDGGQIDHTLINLTFDGFNRNSAIPLFSYGFTTPYSEFVTPKNLPLPSHIRVNSYYMLSDYHQDYRCYKSITFKNDTNLIITNRNSIHLISPDNNEEGINNFTVFKFEDDDATDGIYWLNIYSTREYAYSLSKSLFTRSKSVSLNELRYNGFQLSPNTMYIWRVAKIVGFSSIEEYLSGWDTFQKKYTGYNLSNERYFKTAP